MSMGMVLNVIGLLLNLKAECEMRKNCFDRMMVIVKDEILLVNYSNFPSNLFESKKLFRGLGLGYQKIDVCRDNCMLYYRENETKVQCDKCGKSRYKPVPDSVTRAKRVPMKVMRYLPLIPMLKRHYMSPCVAEHMTWNKNGIRSNPDKIIHPSDIESWKNFDLKYPEFAAEPRNVRLGLSTDGFSPFQSMRNTYSCWPVFVVPYNLPPGIALKEQYVFLTVICPGRDYPGKNIDLFLTSLIDELKSLWIHGVET